MLQLTHLYFENLRFDEKANKVLQGVISNYLIRKSKDIRSKIQDGITRTLCGTSHSRKRVFDQEFANEASFEKMKAVYLNRFDNPADFYIVGDVKAAQLEPLLVKYANY